MSVALSHHRWRRLPGRATPRASRTARRRAIVWMIVVCGLGSLSLAAAIAVGATIWLVAWFGGFAGALPPPDQLTARAPFQTTPVFARDGATLLYEITPPEGGRRTIIPLSQMPRYLIEATIATEDAGFFSNPGFEVRAILRAGFEDLTHQQFLSGASTITQQVARNVLLTPEERLDRSARRKVKEIILAYQLTQTYTKNQILAVYLNEIFYGNHSYGVEAAAESYFGKSAAQLDLAECALLAGLPQAPGYYDPYRHLDEVKRRQEYVLQRMVDQGYITPAAAAAAAAEPLHFVDRERAPVAPHFVNYVFDALLQQLGADRLYHGGYHVLTTLDPRLQSLAEQAITTNPSVAAKQSRTNAALVALDPATGEILAMVGSANYDDSSISGEVNAALARRPSSGILRPLTYALALERGQTLASRIVDRPVDLLETGRTEMPRDNRSAHQYLGPVTLRQALGLGLDSPALQLSSTIGGQGLIDLGTKSGIPDFSRRIDFTPGLVIGGVHVSPLEVAQIYAMLANSGVAHQPRAVVRIVDPSRRVVAEPRPVASEAMPASVAYLITSVLADPSVRPTRLQEALQIDRPVAVYSAVSDDQRESWAAGYEPNLAVVVWVGRSDGKPLDDVDAAAQIWANFIRSAGQIRPPAPYLRPPGVVEVSLCQNPACTVKRAEVVLAGSEKAAEEANAAAIGRPRAGVTNSQTPLVNRNRSALVPDVAPVSSLVSVPDVSGITPEQAGLRLLAVGLAVAPSLDEVSSAGLPAALRRIGVGLVVRTTPAAGERVARGTPVVLTVRRS